MRFRCQPGRNSRIDEIFKFLAPYCWAIDQNVEKSVKHVILHSTAESGFEKFKSSHSSLRPHICH